MSGFWPSLPECAPLIASILCPLSFSEVPGRVHWWRFSATIRECGVIKAFFKAFAASCASDRAIQIAGSNVNLG